MSWSDFASKYYKRSKNKGGLEMLLIKLRNLDLKLNAYRNCGLKRNLVALKGL